MESNFKDFLIVSDVKCLPEIDSHRGVVGWVRHHPVSEFAVDHNDFFSHVVDVVNRQNLEGFHIGGRRVQNLQFWLEHDSRLGAQLPWLNHGLSDQLRGIEGWVSEICGDNLIRLSGN